MIHVRPALVTADPTKWQLFAGLLGVQATDAATGTAWPPGYSGAMTIREAHAGNVVGSMPGDSP